MLEGNQRKEKQEQEMILQLNKQVIIILLDSARYLVRQGLAFRRDLSNEELEKSSYDLSLKSLSDTRWTANYESIYCIIESYNEIVRYYGLIEEEKQFDHGTKLQGKNLRNKLVSYEIVVLLKFMENITRTINSLTIHLQSK
ncbi:unnamed protein product [Rotaria sp. Silwood1]|nr:unnamed protein product [Rotaria sp. Silwood1]